MHLENTEYFPKIGEMKKRRVMMADGRRYLIYYTFEPLPSAVVGGPAAQINPLATAGDSDRSAKIENEATEEREVSENV